MNKSSKFLALASVSLLSVISASSPAIAENISTDNAKEKILNPSKDVASTPNLPVTVQELKLSTQISSKASDLINKDAALLAQTPESTNTPAPAPQNEIPASPDIEEQQPGFGSTVTIIPQISTLGAGLGLATPINGNLMARTGLNYTGLGLNFTNDATTYNGNLNLISVSALIDYYPFGINSFFAITGGIAYQNNRINGVINSGTVTYGGVTYQVPSDSSVNANVKFPNNFAPYLGLTFGGSNGTKSGLGFFANVGVLFTGSPQLDLNAVGSINTLVVNGKPFTQSLSEENAKFQKDINSFPGIYPVISIGLTYQF